MKSLSCFITLSLLALLLLTTPVIQAKILNVHIVPHTHDDVGWLKTADQYYFGKNNTIQHVAVQVILSSVIPSLEGNPNRKFTYVEQAFFSRWYYNQTPDMKSRVQVLISSKQLSFANGGWVMHDEATTHYLSMLSQTKLGHDFLKETFNYAPTVGWQIDPFGHSSTQSSLLSAAVGFDALYFGRIDHQDLTMRRKERRVEGLMRTSLSLPNAQVFFSLFLGNYNPPEGYCFDSSCRDDEPMIDDENSDEYNIPARVQGFAVASYKQANEARGNNIMMTMGSDFQYENSTEWFRNLDSLIKHTNEYQQNGKLEADPYKRFSGINVFYSNPEIYTKAKNDENIAWEVKTDDFLPYSDCAHCFWTGYFTSRAELKKFERFGSAFLEASRQIEAADSSFPSSTIKSTFHSPLHELDAAVAVLNHHDGVTGTSKQHVAYDYAKKLDIGLTLAAEYTIQVLKDKLLKSDSSLHFEFCQGLNVTVCATSQAATRSLNKPGETSLFVVAYNALSHPIIEPFAVPISVDAAYVVTVVASGEVVESSLLPSSFLQKDSAP